MHHSTLISVLLVFPILSIAAPAAKSLAEIATIEEPVKRTVDETGLISSEIEKAGNTKRTVDETYIITPIEKATKEKRSVDETGLVSSAIEKAGDIRRRDDAYFLIERAASNKRTVGEELINTSIE